MKTTTYELKMLSITITKIYKSKKFMSIKASELILNPDGSVYHLKLRPEHLRNHIITVGDPARVDMISKYLDEILFEQINREFRTLIGRIGELELMVVGTGIGTDNLDIVINELDILANVDLSSRTIKSDFIKLNFYRIGTSGALIDEVAVDSFVISHYALGMDSLMKFYKYEKLSEILALESSVEKFLTDMNITAIPYASAAGKHIFEKFENMNWTTGITLTNPGFYGPQGRKIRYGLQYEDYLDRLRDFKFLNYRICNLEMETAGLYGLCNMLGHEAISLNAIIANRSQGTFSKEPQSTVNKLIRASLGVISAWK